MSTATNHAPQPTAYLKRLCQDNTKELGQLETANQQLERLADACDRLNERSVQATHESSQLMKQLLSVCKEIEKNSDKAARYSGVLAWAFVLLPLLVMVSVALFFIVMAAVGSPVR